MATLAGCRLSVPVIAASAEGTSRKHSRRAARGGDQPMARAKQVAKNPGSTMIDPNDFKHLPSLNLDDVGSWSFSRVSREEHWWTSTIDERVNDIARASAFGGLPAAKVLASFVSLLDSSGYVALAAGEVAASAYGIPRTTNRLAVQLDVDEAGLEELVARHADELRLSAPPVDVLSGQQAAASVSTAELLFQGSHVIEAHLHTWWGSGYALDNAARSRLLGEPLGIVPAVSYCLHEALDLETSTQYDLLDVLRAQCLEVCRIPWLVDHVTAGLVELFGAGHHRVQAWKDLVREEEVRLVENPTVTSIFDLPWVNGVAPDTPELRREDAMLKCRRKAMLQEVDKARVLIPPPPPSSACPQRH